MLQPHSDGLSRGTVRDVVIKVVPPLRGPFHAVLLGRGADEVEHALRGPPGDRQGVLRERDGVMIDQRSTRPSVTGIGAICTEGHLDVVLVMEMGGPDNLAAFRTFPQDDIGRALDFGHFRIVSDLARGFRYGYID